MKVYFVTLFVTAIIEAKHTVYFDRGVAPPLLMNDGRYVPSFGITAWLGFDENYEFQKPMGIGVERAIETAIDAGYRHIDTAYIYGTEEQVGRAVNRKINEGVVERRDLFIVTKLWSEYHKRDAVIPILKESLRNLNLTYVDLYLMHFPIGLMPGTMIPDDTDYVETWRAMMMARNLGLTKSIGVCNFNEQQIRRLMAITPVPPAILQIEVNFNMQDTSLISFARNNGILVTGYMPFGSLFYHRARSSAPPPRVDDKLLTSIADKYNKTVPQLALRYQMELGCIPIPSSITKNHILENLDVWDFSLSAAERRLMSGYNKKYRTLYLKYDDIWKQSPNYPFKPRNSGYRN